MKVRISTADWVGVYEAADAREAIRLFFGDIQSGKIELLQLGAIGSWSEGADSAEIPFRIAPALWVAERISSKEVLEAFKRAGVEFRLHDLFDMAQADEWMVS